MILIENYSSCLGAVWTEDASRRDGRPERRRQHFLSCLAIKAGFFSRDIMFFCF